MQTMKQKTGGFTLIELMVVILIGSILVGVSLNSFSGVQSRFAARSAKQTYATWHQRARSMAIERGETIIMVVWVQGDSTALLTRDGGSWEWSDVQRFDEELGVDLRTQGNYSFYMCMTPRGYADRSCGSWGATYGYTATFSDTVRLQFWQGADSASVLILPMGQVIG
jgi:prepilin-type N-terminal cleavage/methylation domain-containing protein